VELQAEITALRLTFSVQEEQWKAQLQTRLVLEASAAPSGEVVAAMAALGPPPSQTPPPPPPPPAAKTSSANSTDSLLKLRQRPPTDAPAPAPDASAPAAGGAPPPPPPPPPSAQAPGLGRALRLKSTPAAEESQDKPKLERQQGFSMDRLQQQLLAAIAARTAAVAAASSEFDAPPVPPRDDDHALRSANGADDAWASPLPSPHRAVHAGITQEAGQGRRQRWQTTSNGYRQSAEPLAQPVPPSTTSSTCASCATCSAASVPQAPPTPSPARTNYNFAAPATSSPGLRMVHKPAGVRSAKKTEKRRGPGASTPEAAQRVAPDRLEFGAGDVAAAPVTVGALVSRFGA
jgi:hypothetical protein